jgi:hypothetical protein
MELRDVSVDRILGTEEINSRHYQKNNVSGSGTGSIKLREYN